MGAVVWSEVATPAPSMVVCLGLYPVAPVGTGWVGGRAERCDREEWV
jgi:hypothetical protein